MTKTEELLKLAVDAGEVRLTFQGPDDDPAVAYICACDPATIKQLVELVRLQHEILNVVNAAYPNIWTGDAIAAYERFEKGEG